MDKYNYLNDQEKLLVESFFKNEVQREAVRKILLAGIYEQGVPKEGKPHDPKQNWALALSMNVMSDEMSNTRLGENLRAVSEGIRFVENAFREMGNFGEKPTDAKPKKNPGR